MIFKAFLFMMLSFSVCAGMSEEFKLRHCGTFSGTGPVLSYQVEDKHYSMQKIAQDSYLLLKWSKEGIRSEVLENWSHVSDFLIQDNSLWILNANSISELSLNGLDLIEEFSIPRADSYQLRGRGMDLYKEKIYIAQGILGVREFDLSLREFSDLYPMYTKNKNGKRSEVTDLTFDKNFMYMSLATAGPGAFTGVTSFNMETDQIDHLGAYNIPKIGVLGPYSKIYNHGERLFINNEGWVHTISIKSFNRKKKITPRWLAHSSEQGGETIYSLIRGDLTFNQDKILGCDQKKTIDRVSKKRVISKVFVEISFSKL